MLNIEIRDDLHPTIKQLLVDFRRVQVSRFPINVVSHANDAAVKFVDSRFPTDTWRKDRILAWLGVTDTDSKGRPVLTLYSRLVKNEKYSRHNDDYYTKSTFDVKKMATYLRQYVKPYNAEEIMVRIPKPEQEHFDWLNKPRTDFYNNHVRQVRPDVLANEVMYLQSMGVHFKSDEFRELATKGLELYGESERRKNANLILVSVFMQPDDSLLVGWPTTDNIQMGSATYDSMENAPEAIQHKIAMLKMCERGTFIPELGRMQGDRAYWILVSPSEFNFSNT